jgi:2-(1,2-epoxy-1,2-dihydrophenyl)acetyl-CoA isomerase
MAGYETLTLEIDRGVANLAFDRAADANAIDLQLAADLLAAIDEAESHEGCHVLLVSGNGRFFSAGGDVTGMAGASDPGSYLRDLARAASDAMLRLVRSRLVVVSVVHGPAAGAGLAVVLNSDLVVASPSASFLAAYAGVGLTPDCGVSYLLPRAIGPARAAELCLNGRVLTAEEALEWGLITELHPDAELRVKATELAARLAASATQTLGPTKGLLRADALSGYEAALDREVESISGIAASSEDTRNRLAAFVARKKSGA